jgi:hypothetical protein
VVGDDHGGEAQRGRAGDGDAVPEGALEEQAQQHARPADEHGGGVQVGDRRALGEVDADAQPERVDDDGDAGQRERRPPQRLAPRAAGRQPRRDRQRQHRQVHERRLVERREAVEPRLDPRLAGVGGHLRRDRLREGADLRVEGLHVVLGVGPDHLPQRGGVGVGSRVAVGQCLAQRLPLGHAAARRHQQKAVELAQLGLRPQVAVQLQHLRLHEVEVLLRPLPAGQLLADRAGLLQELLEAPAVVGPALLALRGAAGEDLLKRVAVPLAQLQAEHGLELVVVDAEDLGGEGGVVALPARFQDGVAPPPALLELPQEGRRLPLDRAGRVRLAALALQLLQPLQRLRVLAQVARAELVAGPVVRQAEPLAQLLIPDDERHPGQGGCVALRLEVEEPLDGRAAARLGHFRPALLVPALAEDLPIVFLPPRDVHQPHARERVDRLDAAAVQHRERAELHDLHLAGAVARRPQGVAAPGDAERGRGHRSPERRPPHSPALRSRKFARFSPKWMSMPRATTAHDQ